MLYDNSSIHTLGWYTLIEENIDITLLQKAWNLLHQHIDTLRLRMFINADNEAVQYIQEQSTPVLVNEYDVSSLPDPENSALLWMKQQTNRPIDYVNEIPYQFTLIRLANGKNYFFTTFHHIFIDALGSYLLHEYVYKLYVCIKNRASITWLAEIPQYLIAVEKSRKYLNHFNYEDDKNYWLDFLKKNEIHQLTPYYQKTSTDSHTLTLPFSVKNDLRAFCQKNKTHLLAVFSTLVSIVIAELTGQQELVFNTTTHGRTTKSEKYVVGMQANTYPVHCHISRTSSVIKQIKQVESALKTSYLHGKFPTSHFTRLAKQYEFSLPNIFILYDRFSVSTTEINQTQHFHIDTGFNINPILFRLKDYGCDQELKITIQYLHAYFSDSDINNILERLNNLLAAIIDNSDILVSELPILLERERHTLLHSWNQTDAPYQQDKTLQQLFEAQVAQRPDTTAIVFEDQNVSYGELNRRANQLAHHLIALGVRLDDRVAICLERSPEMVIGILAILKAGGAYLPLDPAYPTERLTYMLEDAAPVALLTNTAQAEKLATSVPTVWLDNPMLDFGTQPDNNPDTQALGLTARHLAYVIYTSGSTGKPKGVMVEHRNILRLIINNGFADIGPDDCVAHCANPAFDAATWEIWSALLNGSCLHIVPQAVLLEPTSFREALRKGKVTALWLTVGLFNEYLDTLQPVFGQLRYLLVGGDVLNPQKIKQVLSADHQPVHLLNGYGPTESTTFATTYEITAPVDVTKSIPIGRPISNTRIYLLDNHQQLVPPGAEGEIYIGGDGVARGYLNHPELTEERFLANPFFPECGAKMYKTGDLGRYLPDGNIEYLGRNDFQVKIRGFRIELGEIESALVAHPQVRQAVVIDRKHRGQKVLAAYLVAEDAVSDDMLLTHLSDRLPDYMLPASFTFIDAIPLTQNGKVNRRALPDPIQRVTDHYAAPRNALETQLCTLWQAVLGVSQVGIHDNFFRIGGDSIVSIQLASKLRQAGFSLQVKTIFEAPTVAQLAPLLLPTATTADIVAEQGVLNGEFALLPVQQTFFEWSLAQPHHWNQAFMIQIPGHLQAVQLEQALMALTERHDMLRARFVVTEQGYRQCYSADISASLPRLKHADVHQHHQEALHQQLTQWQSGFDYHNGPLWQVAYLTGYADGSARLHFACHHLIIDVVSWRIIAEDLRLLLQGGDLPAKTSSYRQWVTAVHQYAQQHQHEVLYWQQVLAGHHSELALGHLTHHQLGLSAEMTDILLHNANKGYHTEINDLLLSALTVALQETFGQSVNHILLEGHGRESIDNTLDLSETVGWFTTLYPVRLENQSDIADTLIHIKEMLRAVPNKGIGYGALQQAGYLTGDLPAISFNYLGQLGRVSHQDWSIMDDDCGNVIASENDSHLLLGINGSVQAGKLRFYVDSRLPQAKTALFIRAFEQALHDVIMTAQKQARTGGIKTASDYGIKGLSVKHLRHLQQRYQLEVLSPASSLQQGFIYHHLAQPQDDAYRVQLLLDYHSNIDMAAYQQAWTLASLRFPILRTAFDWSENLLQIVTEGVSIGATNFAIKDISQLPEEMWNEAIDKLQQSDRTLPFDLSQPGLARFTLIKQHQQLVTVLITLHHSIIDGWSYPILLQTVHEYYNSLVQGRQPEIVVDNAYLAAQQYYCDHQAEADLYWSERKMQWLGANDLSALLSQRVDLALIKTVEKPAEQQLIMQDYAYEQLKNTCRTQGVTLNVALQFAWHKLLHIYTGDAQTIVGTTVSGRDIPVAGIESSVGLYINTLPLVVQWGQADNIATILQHIQKDIADLNSYSAVSLSGLQSDGERLFQSLLVFENYPVPVADENLTGIEQSLTFRRAVEKVDYPLSLIVYEQGNQLIIRFNYGEDWMTEEQAQRLLEQIERILHAVACYPEQLHTTITCLSEAEHHTLLHSWNQTDAPYPQDKTLPQLFEAQVARTPDHVALVFEGESLTYHQLNQRANQLAHAIRERYQKQHHQTMQADTPIALYFDRSPEMIISILAVLKAGGAYVPVSPEYPTERVQFILTDTATLCVLTQQHYLTTLRPLAGSSILIAADNQADTVSQPVENPDSISKPTDLAYIIYTSGTTGQPKGVMIEHTGANNLSQFIARTHLLKPHTRALFFSNYVFDASVFEIFPVLITGASLFIVPTDMAHNSEQLLTFINTHDITKAFIPTALINAFSAELFRSSLHIIHTGGEALNTLAIRDGVSVFNQYGPTEITVCATQHPLQSGDKSIGKGIDNTRLYVLDRNGYPVPIGVPGELYIGGAGVARGYLNQPELTAERFVANPFATPEDKVKGYTRLYKTGDLVRWLPNGDLEYLGRNDFQVKIRGYRIELGEIENALTAHPQVKQAVVIDREYQGHKVLAAYLVAGDAVSDEMLLAHLSERLPEYMLPASFTFIDMIPLTQSGKVDRRALPEPVFGDRENYVAPRNALEIQLCTIWQVVLGLERVSIHDNFFRIGGDSIVSIQLVSKLRQAGFSLQVKTIFDAPTVAQLALLLMQSASTADIVAEQGILHGEFALLPVQQSFFDWPLVQSHHWNQAFMVQIPGHLHAVQLEQALIALTERHDILRARFVATDQGYRQCYSADISASLPPLKHADVRQYHPEALHQQLTQWQSGFDYHNGPLWQVAHLTGYADGSARLFFACHHLIIDAVSWRIIAEDMRLLLQKIALPAKTSSYRQWVTAVQRYAQQHQNEASYWQQVLAGHHSPSALGHLTHHQLGISVEMTDILLHDANQGYHTEINDVLLSALSVALQDTFDQSVNHILLEGHGREPIDNTIDISETVGWFTTIYPVRLENKADITDTLIHTKEMLRAVPNKGIGYGALQWAGYLDGDLPAISFNYLGQLGSALHQDWSITDDDCGNAIASENDNHLLLDINGAVQAGKLRFYVDSRLPQSKTALFIRAFEQALHDVIMAAQKQAQTGGVKTASDYGIKGVSLEQFNQLTQYFEHTNHVSSHHDSENKTILDL
ncbi:amino acid adenylation domain-containing protein [Xenorhabdus stockiae]|uniref:amino acid adenylation domain-containing protein n=1 Tax=Xenorhabdus stockiae TaxID=351614 RepID=UPI003CFBBFF3